MHIPLLIKLFPVILILLIAEMIYSYRENRELYLFKDTLNNLMIGVTYFASNAISKVTFFAAISWMSRFHVISLGNSWWVWLLCFMGNDFTFYIYHKAAHEINWLWASHATHHSSEKLNITTAFRQSWTTNITGHFVFWLWMPFLGFSPEMIMIVSQLSFLYQYLLHSETIGRLPAFIEFIFNTPSHHRVHHSSNPEYLDKNHGGVLIIWDRIFGTYCDENTKPVYGLTEKLKSGNPVIIVFSSWNDLFQKAFRSGSVKNFISYFIMPPGWSHDGSSCTVKQARDQKCNRRKTVRLADMFHSEPNPDPPVDGRNNNSIVPIAIGILKLAK
ncbi:MAG: sterol desaturase family protein [Bacteroidota bacterium]